MSKHVMFVSVPLLGHTNQMLALAQALASRGHRVSFVIHEVAKTWLANLDIQVIPWHFKLGGREDVYTPEREIFWGNISQEANSCRSDKLMIERVITFYTPMYESLQEIVQQQQPDCLVIDRAVIPAMDLAQHKNLPFVIQTRFLGNFVKGFRKYPQFGTAYWIHMNLWQRGLNFLKPRLQQVYLLPTMLKLNQIRQQCTHQKKLPSPWEGHPIIVGTSFGIELPRPLPAHIHMVGPIFSKTMQPLSDSLRDWLEADSETLVIYMAFGTLVTLNAWQARELVEGLTASGIKVLWSLPESQRSLLPKVPDSFRIEAFVPQQSVLAHPRVMAFVSHCGMNGINEALYYGKPILALPFFGDQHYNAARLVDLGVALKLNKISFDHSEVRRKLHQILEHQSYRDHATQISTALKQTNGLEKGIEVIETFLK